METKTFTLILFHCCFLIPIPALPASFFSDVSCNEVVTRAKRTLEHGCEDLQILTILRFAICKAARMLFGFCLETGSWPRCTCDWGMFQMGFGRRSLAKTRGLRVALQWLLPPPLPGASRRAPIKDSFLVVPAHANRCGLVNWNETRPDKPRWLTFGSDSRCVCFKLCASSFKASRKKLYCANRRVMMRFSLRLQLSWLAQTFVACFVSRRCSKLVCMVLRGW